MVAVAADEPVHMHREPAPVGQGTEEILEELRGCLTHAFGRENNPPRQKWPPAQIHHHARERLVERNVRRPEPAHPLQLAERFGQAIAEGQPHVLHGVVGVHVEVAVGLHRQRHPRMPRQRLQHVIEEADTGGDFDRRHGRVEVELDPDARFARLAQPDRSPARQREDGWGGNAHATGDSGIPAP